MTLKILIVGGYGTFGGRLAQLLANEPRLTLFIAGRSHEKAKAFCDRLDAKASAVPLAFDREGDVESQLRKIGPVIVIDASGPFQAYGGAFRVVSACLSLGINYLDLADGSDFVKGVTQFDAQATARGVFIISGVSSFPVLTAAVVRMLSAGMTRLDRVTGGIAPSPYAGVGLNVIRAIASYSGQPVDLVDGRHYALVETRSYTIAPPGRLPLYPIRFSLVDVPDLRVLPALWPDLKSVWMGAGPVPEILHRALNVMARLVRLKILPSLSPLAPLMYRAINIVRWGEHRGGMFVEAEGLGVRGESVRRSWHMIAEGDDGPFIPSMAAEAIVRLCIEGKHPVAGARAATGELELANYDALFADRKIFAGLREQAAETAPLYKRLLGDAWLLLPEPLRVLHDLNGDLAAEGRATVERGNGFVARWIAALFGFPPAGVDVPVRVTFRRDGAREIWQRDFAGRRFSSIQEEGRGTFERLVCERFGPFAFGLALVLENERLKLIVRRWTLFSIPMPLALAPGGEAFESAEDGRFNFHVEIGHRLTGLVVRYRGWLQPVA
jgi:hypothetical protein